MLQYTTRNDDGTHVIRLTRDEKNRIQGALTDKLTPEQRADLQVLADRLPQLVENAVVEGRVESNIRHFRPVTPKPEDDPWKRPDDDPPYLNPNTSRVRRPPDGPPPSGAVVRVQQVHKRETSR